MIERKWKLKIKKMIAVLIAGVVLMLVKFTAYFITHSNAILTDALESIINVVAGSFALYSLYYSSQPKDSNHPYGHGKIEYLASGFEGSLIGISGILIGVKSVQNFFYPAELHALDIGVPDFAIYSWGLGL